MFRTIKEIKAHKEQITSKGLQTAIIYFMSHILNGVEERHIYADDINELRAWLNENLFEMKRQNIEYMAYLNSCLEYKNGDITKNLK